MTIVSFGCKAADNENGENSFLRSILALFSQIALETSITIHQEGLDQPGRCLSSAGKDRVKAIGTGQTLINAPKGVVIVGIHGNSGVQEALRRAESCRLAKGINWDAKEDAGSLQRIIFYFVDLHYRN
jgi:hypothetical protein